MDKIKVGIIGCGTIARQRHANEYSKNSDVTIAGFYDINILRAEAMVKDFGGQIYEAVEDLIADPDIDAVSICATNKDHAHLTIAALEHNKHVLCEKPMATSLQDCEKMYAAAAVNNKHLLIGHNQRLTPTHLKAKLLLDSGVLGRVINFQSTFGHAGPEMWSVDKSADTWFFKKGSASFGSLADLGIHKIDLMRYLVGGKVTMVYSTMVTLDKKFSDGSPIEVDDNSVEVLSFDNGALGTISTSWTHYGEECNATVLYCEKGIMKLYCNPQYSLEIIYKDGRRENYEIDHVQTNDDVQQESSGVIDVFVDAVKSDSKTPLDAEEALESMRVVFACISSSENQAAVNLM